MFNMERFNLEKLNDMAVEEQNRTDLQLFKYLMMMMMVVVVVVVWTSVELG